MKASWNLLIWNTVMMVKNLLHYFIPAYYISHNLKSKLLHGDQLSEVLYFFYVIADSVTVFQDMVVASHNLPCIGFHIITFFTLPSLTNSSCTARPKACGHPWRHVWLAKHPVTAHAHWGKHCQIISCTWLLAVIYTRRWWVPLHSINTTMTPMLATTAAPTKRSCHKNPDMACWWSSEHATLTRPSWTTDANGGITINHDNGKHHHHHCTTTSHTPH